ncbi:sulfotransferase family protein [Rhizohabitans arisaemae]|uniref:sulfotransferase family protein n=1 Tax=Rhizohabitans arisaemae TaxID=2720610 RepID=UPI0024B1F001|nr:sulfotransferase [Rhizohabitans arisaemae]
MRPEVKRVAHSVSRTVGRASHHGRLLPSFMIIGAQRSGTTSLYRTLSRHPMILKPVLHKGIHYFDVDYTRGMSWYRAHFPLTATGRRIERRYGARPLAFEASPYYLFHPLAPARIAADLPGVKLIVLVRDPVERAYSAHAHEVARGFESETFVRALDLEAERLSGQVARISADAGYVSHAHRHQAYLARGRYADQLDRLLPHFGEERIHVVDSGRLFHDPEPVYDRILEFLGLPRLCDPVLPRLNARSRVAMPPWLRVALSAHFQPSDERLCAWLGGVPSWRRTDP